MKLALTKVEIVEALPITIRFKVPERSQDFVYVTTRNHFGDKGKALNKDDMWLMWVDLDANLQDFKKEGNIIINSLYKRDN